jgi:hypothetical protein
LFIGVPEGKGPLGTPIDRCVDNIKINLGGIQWGGMDLIDLAQDRGEWRLL